jgi:hypothetical protein
MNEPFLRNGRSIGTRRRTGASVEERDERSGENPVPLVIRIPTEKKGHSFSQGATTAADRASEGDWTPRAGEAAIVARRIRRRDGEKSDFVLFHPRTKVRILFSDVPGRFWVEDVLGRSCAVRREDLRSPTPAAKRTERDGIGRQEA